MEDMLIVYIWIAEILCLFGTLFAFVYGLRHFFKPGKPLYLQCVAMAMGTHTLGTIFHICQTLTNQTVWEGFTPAYLGRIGFFLFFIVASYGHMDAIVDDGSKAMRLSRVIALSAPLVVVMLYLVNFFVEDVPLSTRISYISVFLPAMINTYYHLKHSLLPDLDFGFTRAHRPYNILALALSISELLCMTAWMYLEPVLLVLAPLAFALLCIATVIAARKGVQKWTI